MLTAVPIASVTVTTFPSVEVPHGLHPAVIILADLVSQNVFVPITPPQAIELVGIVWSQPPSPFIVVTTPLHVWLMQVEQLAVPTQVPATSLQL